MILQALYNYYNVAPNMPPYGMKYQAIPFIIVIDENGKFIRLEDTRSDEEKNGRMFLLPKAKPRSGKNSYEVAQVLWDFGQYVVGLPLKKDGTRPEHFASFQKELRLLSEKRPKDIGLNAVLQFYQTNQLEALFKDNVIKGIEGKEDKIKFSFRLESEDDHSILIVNSPALEIGSYLRELDFSANESRGICAITGNETNLCRIHETIDIKAGGTNPRILAFQKSSGFDSYGKEQGANAPISLEASDAIHSALNTLIRHGEETNYYLSGITYIFWSTPPQDELAKMYRESTFDLPIEENEQKGSNEYRNRSKKLLQSLKATIYSKGVQINNNSEDRFYILGLTPNNSRISVVLWQESSISEIIGNTFQHLQDMNIIESDGYYDDYEPPLRSIPGMVRSISTMSESDKWSKLMVKNIVRSVVCHLPYPREMQLACLERIRAERRVTTLRAAILKGYLIRSKTNNYHITMALDKSNTNVAYLLGRLFSLLEGMQSAALGNDLNATIRDRYYGAASTAPASTFGQLMKLYGAHQSKLRKGSPSLARFYDKIVAEVFNKLTSDLPVHFDANEQSLFAIGYYHQKIDLYTNKEQKEYE